MNRIIREIPRVNKNTGLSVNAVNYTYDVNATAITEINGRIQQLVNMGYLDNGMGLYTDQFWMNRHILAAYDSGTTDILQTADNITQAAEVGDELAREVRAFTAGEEYSAGKARRSAMLLARDFELMKGLTDGTRSDLASTLARAMKDGKGIQEISKEIAARIDVSGSRATKIARTEINHAYRIAGRDETDVINNDVFKGSDWEMRMLWFSALTSTTRRTHGRKHGKTFTTGEVSSFYSRDANEINCYCSQTATLVNVKTGEVLQKDLTKQMGTQKDKWFGEDIEPVVAPKVKPVVEPKKQKTDIIRPIGFENADSETKKWIENAFTGTEYNSIMSKVNTPANIGKVNQGAYYLRGNINMGSHENTEKGNFVYRHEFGHLVDLSPETEYFSNSKRYKNAMDSDREFIKGLESKLIDDYKHIGITADTDSKTYFKDLSDAHYIKVSGEMSKAGFGPFSKIDKKKLIAWGNDNIVAGTDARIFFDAMDFSKIRGKNQLGTLRFNLNKLKSASEINNKLLTLNEFYMLGDDLHSKFPGVFAAADNVFALTKRWGGGHSLEYYNRLNGEGEGNEIFANTFAMIAGNNDNITFQYFELMMPNLVKLTRGIIKDGQ
jgi:hypothetical protein